MNKANARRVRGEGTINNREVNAFAGRGEVAVFLITGAITGTLLGLRFRVLVLVTASVLAAVVIIISQSGQKLHIIVLTLVGTVAALQMGYVAGSILRFLARSYLPAWTRGRSRRKCLE